MTETLIHVCPRYSPEHGGVETTVRHIAEGVSHKMSVGVVCTGDLVPSFFENRVKIIHRPRFAPFNAYYLSHGMKKAIDKENPNIIHAHNYHAIPAYYATTCKRPEKFIFSPYLHARGGSHLRNLLLGPYKKLIGERIFSTADTIITMSESERYLISRNFTSSLHKTVTIPPGIDYLAVCTAQPFETATKIVLYIGRLEKYKNVQLLIHAVGRMPGFSLVIIGTGSYEPHLKLIAKGYENIAFLGAATDAEKYTFLKSCRVFANLSPLETFGISVVEALAAGKPVVLNPDCMAFYEFSRYHDVYYTKMSIMAIRESLYRASRSKPIGNDVSEYSWGNIVKKYERIYGDRL